MTSDVDQSETIPAPTASPWRSLLLALAIGLLGATVIWWATDLTVGASRDSVKYIRQARVLACVESPNIGATFPDHMTHYPPAYPLLISAGLRLGIEALDAARWINIACYVLLTVGSAGLVYHFSRGTARAVAAALLVGSGAGVLPIHLWAVSEPVFLVQLLAIFGAASIYLSKPRIVTAALLGGAIALATITRYAGIAFLPAGLLLASAASIAWRQRLLHALLLVLFVGFPLALLGYSHRLAGAMPANRSTGYEPISAAHWEDLRHTVAEWLWPLAGETSWWIALPLAALWILLAFLARRHGRVRIITLAIAGAYLAMLIFSIAMVDATTPLDQRLLAPVFLALAIWSCAELGTSRRRTLQPAAAIGAGLLGIVILAGGIIRDAQAARTSREIGNGVSHRAFADSPLIRRCKQLPEDAMIFTNYPDALFIHTGRSATILPGRPVDPQARTAPMEPFVNEMKTNLARNGGYVAYFNFRSGKRPRMKPLRIDQLQELLPLRVIDEVADGTLLQCDPFTLPPSDALPTSMPAERRVKRSKSPRRDQR